MHVLWNFTGASLCAICIVVINGSASKGAPKTCDNGVPRCLGWSMYHQGRAEGDRAAHVGWVACREGNEEKKKRRRGSGSEVKMELKCADGT